MFFSLFCNAGDALQASYLIYFLVFPGVYGELLFMASRVLDRGSSTFGFW
jgi:hypothetical protein